MLYSSWIKMLSSSWSFTAEIYIGYTGQMNGTKSVNLRFKNLK